MLQVELSTGGGDGGVGDATLQVAQLKLEFASYLAAPSSAPQRPAAIRCPLCNEEHPVDEEKGVVAFRKDHRSGFLNCKRGSRILVVDHTPEVQPKWKLILIRLYECVWGLEGQEFGI